MCIVLPDRGFCFSFSWWYRWIKRIWPLTTLYLPILSQRILPFHLLAERLLQISLAQGCPSCFLLEMFDFSGDIGSLRPILNTSYVVAHMLAHRLTWWQGLPNGDSSTRRLQLIVTKGLKRSGCCPLVYSRPHLWSMWKVSTSRVVVRMNFPHRNPWELVLKAKWWIVYDLFAGTYTCWQIYVLCILCVLVYLLIFPPIPRSLII